MIRYQVTSRNPAGHYFDVSLSIARPDPAGQVLRLPNWIPGSYMIRDFARNLLDLQASCNGAAVTIAQLDKSNWRAEPCDGALRVDYRVYARDLSVRAAHLDLTHGYYNGTSLFLEVAGQGEAPCEVAIEKPGHEVCRDWRVATSLAAVDIGEDGYGLYRALDYDDLVDHPVEMGTFTRISFEACGVPHDVILTGRFRCDEARLADDLARICEQHIRTFGEPAPMDYYQFQVLVVGDGYGGLEHRASTSLVASRDSLPQPGETEVSEDYREFLGLCSHEYFHTWNVKRIKPAVYNPYDLQQEVYTELLWAFEGITSYYDDLGLVRAGLIDGDSYLELLARTMTRVERGIGRTRQSAAESSFNTWTKFYKQDENAANAIVSYYAKGALIAACIDLRLRAVTDNRASLDDVMRELWRRYQQDGRGVGEDEIQRLISELAGNDMGAELDGWIRGRDDLPLPRLLADLGIEVARRPATGVQDKGGKPVDGELPRVDIGAVYKDDNGGLLLQRVVEEGAAQAAGLAAGDSIVALDGIRLNAGQLEKRLLRAAPGDRWRVHAFRRDELFEVELELQPAAESTFVLTLGDDPGAACRAWLGIE